MINKRRENFVVPITKHGPNNVIFTTQIQEKGCIHMFIVSVSHHYHMSRSLKQISTVHPILQVAGP